jgi:hypothetical protein
MMQVKLLVYTVLTVKELAGKLLNKHYPHDYEPTPQPSQKKNKRETTNLSSYTTW